MVYQSAKKKGWILNWIWTILAFITGFLIGYPVWQFFVFGPRLKRFKIRKERLSNILFDFQQAMRG
jgi:hypothetical protein